MDKRSRLHISRQSDCRNTAVEIIDEYANRHNLQSRRNCDAGLEIQITKSLEVLLNEKRQNLGLLPTRKDGPCTNTKIPLNNQFNVLSMHSKERNRLLEECKLKLMGNCSDESVESYQTVEKKRDERKKTLKRDSTCGNRKCATKSVQINRSNHSPGPTSNAICPSAHSVINKNKCRYRYRHDKHSNEMGDSLPSDKSSETSSEKVRRLKRKLIDIKRDTDIGDTLRQVYATAGTSNIRELLKCQNPNRRKEDPKQPCFCQHCGMVDVLLDSQKRMYTDDYYDLDDSESDQLNRNKLLNSRTDLERSPEKYTLQGLRDRLKKIEIAFREHQEKCVTKDYLKLVVEKLISYIAPKSECRQPPGKTTPKKDNSTQCRNKLLRCREAATLKTETARHRHHDQIVGNVMTVHNAHQKRVDQQPEESKSEELCWKWGEETIKPGHDLKEKIIQLINVVIGASKRNTSDSNAERKIATGTITPSEKTLYLYGTENQTAATSRNLRNSSNSLKSGGNFRKMLDYMSEKIYADYISGDKEDEDVTLQRTRAINDDLFKQNMRKAKEKSGLLTEDAARKQDTARNVSKEEVKGAQKPANKKSQIPTYRKNSRVEVTYLSPKAESWKDSCVCYKVEQYFKKYIEGKCGGPISSEDRIRFIKKVALSRNCNDVKLWKSIWTATNGHGLSRKDKLAVQIPEVLRPKGKGCVIKELEFSVGEIQDIAKRMHCDSSRAASKK